MDEEEFFLELVEVSCGPTVERWRSDGYDRKRVEEMMEGIKENTEGYVRRAERTRYTSSEEAYGYEGGEREMEPGWAKCEYSSNKNNSKTNSHNNNNNNNNNNKQQ